MNDTDIAKKITAYLDHGTAEIAAGTAYKLQLARREALSRLGEPQQAIELSLAGAGGGTLGRRRIVLDLRLWIGILLIGGGFLFYQQWQTVKQIREIEETDTAILTSDLPIEAYLDRGFQNWLSGSDR